MIRWIKKKLGIGQLSLEVAMLQAELRHNRDEINTHMAVLKSLARMDADIGARGDCTIILTGVLNGHGYVRFYDVSPEEFNNWVSHFNELKKSHLVRGIDRVPNMRGGFPL